MMDQKFISQATKAPPYRWVVLLVFAINGMLSQVFWINFASINEEVASYYGVPTTSVDLLSLMFMIVYLVVGPFASLLIDSRGFRLGAGVGALLTGGFGFLRYFATGPGNFSLMIGFQIGVAIGQPFLYNAITKVAARWFPPEQRATASGIANLGFLVGILLGFVLPPFLWAYGLPNMMLIFGLLGVVGMILFAVFGKDHPKIPYGETTPIPVKIVFRDLKQLLKMRFALVLAIMALVDLGAFNALSTFIDYITGIYPTTPDEAALLGGFAVIMGIIGSVVFPSISDVLFKKRKTYARKLFLVVGLMAAAPISIAIGVVSDLSTMYILLAVFGFLTVPTLAISMQWIAEETAPIPESESNNLLMYFGQIGGIVFILMVPALFTAFPSPAIPLYSSAMFMFAVLYVIISLLVLFIKKDIRNK